MSRLTLSRDDLAGLREGDLIHAVGQVEFDPPLVVEAALGATPVRGVKFLSPRGTLVDWYLYPYQVSDGGVTVERPEVRAVASARIVRKHGLALTRVQSGVYQTEGGRYRVELNDGYETECERPHPMRIPQEMRLQVLAVLNGSRDPGPGSPGRLRACEALSGMAVHSGHPGGARWFRLPRRRPAYVRKVDRLGRGAGRLPRRRTRCVRHVHRGHTSAGRASDKGGAVRIQSFPEVARETLASLRETLRGHGLGPMPVDETVAGVIGRAKRVTPDIVNGRDVYPTAAGNYMLVESDAVRITKTRAGAQPDGDMRVSIAAEEITPDAERLQPSHSFGLSPGLEEMPRVAEELARLIKTVRR